MDSFTACANGRHEDSRAHDFDDFEGHLGGAPLMYCRRCGEVRRLALPLEEGRHVTNVVVSGEFDPSRLATKQEHRP